MATVSRHITDKTADHGQQVASDHRPAAAATGASGAGRSRLRDVDWLPIDRRRQKFRDLYLLAVDACMRAGTPRWWGRAFGFEEVSEESVAQLKDYCFHQVLLDAGDIRTFRGIFRILDEEGFLEGDERSRFLLDLATWLVEAMPALVVRGSGGAGALSRYVGEVRRRAVRGVNSLLARRVPAIASVVILDGASMSNFFEFCVPSLARDGGLPQLRKTRATTLHVFARERDLHGVKRQLNEWTLECEVVCQAIPEELASRAESVAGPQTEWLTGALQCLHLMEARRAGADFHPINPNAVYADGYFEGLLRLRRAGHPAILLATLYVDQSTMRDHLVPFRQDGKIGVSPGDLIEAGLRAMPGGRGLGIVRDLGYYGGPSSHLQLILEGRDSVQISSTHHEIAYLSHLAVEEMPARFFMKLPTEVDALLRADKRPYFIRETDGVALVDVSNRKDVFNEQRIELAEFGALVAESARERQIEHFRQPVVLNVSRRASPQQVWLADAEIAGKRDVVFKALDETMKLAAPKAEKALTALSVLHQYEVSEYGVDNMAYAIAEGRRILGIIRGLDTVEDVVRRELIRAAMNFDDVDKAMALATQGGEKTAFISDFLVEMAKLRAANGRQARRLRSMSPGRRFSVIGSIVWGEVFVDKFMSYCLPSLLAPGNIPALAKRGRVVHSIVTTEADRERIMAHPAFRELQRSARVVFTCFPADFLQRREKDGLNFYYFYGLLDHQSVFLAEALRADLYLLPIDCVYSGESLKNFSDYLVDQADACSVGAIECDEPELRAWLDSSGHRDGAVLDVSGKDLIQAAIHRPDRFFRGMIMSPANTEFCDHPRELVWPFGDGLAMHSVFMHPLAVSRRLLIRPFHPHHENADYALLPRLLQGDGRLKVLSDASEAVLAHFGAPVTRDHYLEGGFSIKSFIEAHRYDYAIHRRCFDERQFFPCPDVPYAPSTDYEAEVALIQSALKRGQTRLPAK